MTEPFLKTYRNLQKTCKQMLLIYYNIQYFTFISLKQLNCKYTLNTNSLVLNVSCLSILPSSDFKINIPTNSQISVSSYISMFSGLTRKIFTRKIFGRKLFVFFNRFSRDILFSSFAFLILVFLVFCCFLKLKM